MGSSTPIEAQLNLTPTSQYPAIRNTRRSLAGPTASGLAGTGRTLPGGRRLRGGRHPILLPGSYSTCNSQLQWSLIMQGSAPRTSRANERGVRRTKNQKRIIHASALERVWQTILPCDRIGYTHIEPWPLRPRECRQWVCAATQGSGLG
jgi:hypothetical protein